MSSQNKVPGKKQKSRLNVRGVETARRSKFARSTSLVDSKRPQATGHIIARRRQAMDMEKDEFCSQCRRFRESSYCDYAWGVRARVYEYECADETDPEEEDCIRHEEWRDLHPEETEEDIEDEESVVLLD